MSRMEELKFMVDLDWKIRFEGFDRMFSKASYFEEFMKFLDTDTGKMWIIKENGIAFKEWQEQ